MSQEIMQTVNLADYQKGSVVSRTVVDKKIGTVTFFAFDEGQGLSEHTAPFDALIQVLEGEVEIMIAGQPHKLKANEMVLMPGGKPHSVRAIKRFKMLLTMIRA